MAITGIGTLTGLGLNEVSPPQVQSGDKAPSFGSSALPQDQFTPSAPSGQQDNPQAAGLFNVDQVAPFTPAATAFLATTPTAVPLTAGVLQAAGTDTAPLPAAAAAQLPAPPASSANPAATGTASITEQLQLLNNVLQALGLSPADIQQVDQIASVIKDFNPAAFTTLAYQLVALAPPNATQQQANATAAPNATQQQTNATAGATLASSG